MKPLGRKYYKDNTGSKHHTKFKGKYACWWDDVCTPNKRLEQRLVGEDILDGIEEFEVLEDKLYTGSLHTGEYSVDWSCVYQGCDILWHEEGECIACDWRKQMLATSSWSDPNFIEAWDYEEYWVNKYGRGK